MDRDTGKATLSTVLAKEQNVRVLEKNVYDLTNHFMETEYDGEQDYDETVERIYSEHIYQVVGDILSGIKLSTILATIKERQTGWEHPCYTEMQARMEEQDDFIINPFEVEEGVLECHCGSRRVYSYSKQVRSCDEGTTVFAQCMACKAKWQHRG